MATDAAILTAARNHAAAIAAVKEADAVVTRLAGEHRQAATVADEKRKYARECEQTLVRLAAQKPSEPAELPVVENFPHRTPEVVKTAELPVVENRSETAPAPPANPSPVSTPRRRERVGM